MPGFLENWVMDTARSRLVREESLVQSEYPAHSGSAVASGFLAPTSASASILLSIPSSRWFKPRTLIINNNNTAQNQVYLYGGGSAASCSATICGIWISPRATDFVALDGITVGGCDLYASALLGSIELRVAGVLLKSGPE